MRMTWYNSHMVPSSPEKSNPWEKSQDLALANSISETTSPKLFRNILYKHKTFKVAKDIVRNKKLWEIAFYNQNYTLMFLHTERIRTHELKLKHNNKTLDIWIANLQEKIWFTKCSKVSIFSRWCWENWQTKENACIYWKSLVLLHIL